MEDWQMYSNPVATRADVEALEKSVQESYEVIKRLESGLQQAREVCKGRVVLYERALREYAVLSCGIPETYLRLFYVKGVMPNATSAKTTASGTDAVAGDASAKTRQGNATDTD